MNMPLRTFIALPIVALTWLLPASSPAQNILQQSLRDFRVGQFWIYDDWDAARKLAAAEGKPIFAVFRCVP